MNQKILKKIDTSPISPGVYIWKNKSKKIIYVGKAEKLRNRLKNYKNPQDEKTKKLVENACFLDIILTKTDAEALILEDALVKQNQPRYNVRLRDDKKYPYIKVSIKDEFPHIEITRRVEADEARYFGPYTDSKAVKKVVRLITKLFGIRTCTYNLKKLGRPCIKNKIGICACPHLVMPKEEYKKKVEQACDFLSGKHEVIKKNLIKEIKILSKKLQFEKAEKIKKTLEGIDSLSQPQDISSTKLVDMDVLGYAKFNNKSNITQIKVRHGRVVGLLHHRLLGEFSTYPEKAVKAFINQHYTALDFTPKLLITSCMPDDNELIESRFFEKFEKKIKIQYSQRGQKRKLVEMAVENSLHQLKHEKLMDGLDDPLDLLKKSLRLRKRPRRIEGYDISNLGEKHTVGAMVVFTDGKADKKEYRRFSIKGDGQDDAKNMAEMLSRRFNHDEWERPDLILVDGGLPQLKMAIPEIPDGIEVIGLAKKFEEIIKPGVKKPIRLKENNPSLLLLKAVRDESHRFGKNYHKIKRNKGFLKKNEKKWVK